LNNVAVFELITVHIWWWIFTYHIKGKHKLLASSEKPLLHKIVYLILNTAREKIDNVRAFGVVLIT
jgi:hypothetical protein